MSFWKSSVGTVIDGSAEHSHVGLINVIPDNTTAPGIIKDAELKTFDDGNRVYQITYKLMDGDFKSYEVRQKINCFELDVKKRDRNVNMLMRLYKLCGYKASHNNEPTNEDLKPLVGKMIGLKIQEWHLNGNEGNWISEINAIDKDFVTETGIKKAQSTVYSNEKTTDDLDSALSRNSSKKAHHAMADDDIPF